MPPTLVKRPSSTSSSTNGTVIFRASQEPQHAFSFHDIQQNKSSSTVIHHQTHEVTQSKKPRLEADVQYNHAISEEDVKADESHSSNENTSQITTSNENQVGLQINEHATDPAVDDGVDVEVDENDDDEEEEDDDDEQVQKPALPLPPVLPPSANSDDTNSIDSEEKDAYDAYAYLLSVRKEAQKCPKVKVAKNIKPEDFKHRQVRNIG